MSSPRIITDGSGNVFSRRDFAPFGDDLLSGIGSRNTALKYDGDAIRKKFTGKQRDNETNLDYFEARYYSSRWGRFTNPDEFTGGPEELIEFDGMMGHNPTFYAELAEPQSLNKYQYALNNPLRYIDPDGHQSRTADRLNPGLSPPFISKKDADAIGREMEDAGKTTWEGLKTAGKAVLRTGVEIISRMGKDDVFCPECQLYNSNQMNNGSLDAEAGVKEVIVDGNKHSESAKHVADAQKNGKPSVVKVGDRSTKSQRRRDALSGTKTKKGKD